MSLKRELIRLNIAVSILALFTLSACSSSKPSASAVQNEQYQRAMKLFDEKEYEEAASAFEPLMFTTRATAMEDEVLYYLGESYYNSEQYLLAAEMYKRLLQQTSDSPYAKTAQFQLAKSYQQLSPHFELDHEYTVKAINEFRQYIELYPGADTTQIASDVETYRELLKINPENASYKAKYEQAKAALAAKDNAGAAAGAIASLREKLAKNRYSIARNYVQLKKYHAASMYFDQVIKFYPDTIFHEQAWLGKINVAVKRKKWYEARQAIEEYQQRFPDHRDKVEGIYKNVLENFGNS
jgi:outer membrane protein assembly factor BamD